MARYLLLIRGINVGGKNTVSMAMLKTCLEELGFTDVKTYINSGNVILSSDKSAKEIKDIFEQALPKNFKLDSELIKVLVLTKNQLQTVVDDKPKGFGEEPKKYYCDAIFMMDIDTDEAFKLFDPREGVDRVWVGKDVIYSERLGELRVKSRLSKIIGTALYKSMTIRSWGTVTKLLALMDE